MEIEATIPAGFFPIAAQGKSGWKGVLGWKNLFPSSFQGLFGLAFVVDGVIFLVEEGGWMFLFASKHKFVLPLVVDQQGPAERGVWVTTFNYIKVTGLVR